ncbi:MAG TPA: cysteine desulfurase family protein [Verrucomicrobiae bacterium]|nr:cysteine desulfurase family protein [Verrucomicrobiae bacterium]
MSQNLKRPIYLDYHATTPVDPRVLQVMLPYFTDHFGNPASKNHSFGNEAFKAVEHSREILASAIGAKPQEIIFTSGATESINLAIKGVAFANKGATKHFITTATEHKAVLDCFDWLKNHGYETTILPVNSDGFLNLYDLEKSIRPDTVLICVMAANNEIGTLQPLKEIASLCHSKNIYFFTDATQALGKIPLNVDCVDLLAASGHKVYGPKGIGFLYVRRSNPRVVIDPIIHGGGHEKGLRSGTLATPNIVGLAKAVEISVKEMAKEQKRIEKLRDALYGLLQQEIPEIKLNGSKNNRLAGNLNVVFPAIESEALMIALKEEIAVSSGSACTTAAVLPSHVLKAIGLSDAESHSSIRFGLGRYTTSEEIHFAVNLIVTQYKRLGLLR